MITLHCYIIPIDVTTGERAGDAERLPIEIDETRIESKMPSLKERTIIQEQTIVEMFSGQRHDVEESMEEINKLVRAARLKFK